MRLRHYTCYFLFFAVRRGYETHGSPPPSPGSLPQNRMLNGLGEDMDVTHSRLKATQKKMMEIIRTSGGCGQMCVIVVLVLVLVMLIVFATM